MSFCPALDPPLGGSGRKTTTLVREHEYFIPTKFIKIHQAVLGEVENVKVYERRRTMRSFGSGGLKNDITSELSYITLEP